MTLALEVGGASPARVVSQSLIPPRPSFTLQVGLNLLVLSLTWSVAVSVACASHAEVYGL